MSLLNKLYKTFHHDAKKGARITPQQAADAVSKGAAVLVDVREHDEIVDGMAAPALWCATSEIEAGSPKAQDFISSLPKDKAVIVYCAAGVRSGRFTVKLSELGFETANLGGFDDWADAGLPVKKPTL